MSEVLTSNVRLGYFAFRLDNEEFLIVLGDTNKNIIAIIAEKIRSTREKTIFTLKNEQTVSTIISQGAAIDDDHPDFNRTIKQADVALYEAKNSGRNCVKAAKHTI